MIQRLITYTACLLGIFMVGCALNKVRAPIENLSYQQAPDSNIDNTTPVVDDNSSDVTTAAVNPTTSVPVTVTPIAAPITTTTTNSTNSAYWQAPFNSSEYKFKSISSFGNGSKGVNIEGTKGSPILAAAPGRVIYAGNGLKEYGNLIIIRHKDTTGKDNGYLSAYGYNDTMLVKADDTVRRGQQIATMGLYKGRALLHFEIRKHGAPIDPTTLIPDLK